MKVLLVYPPSRETFWSCKHVLPLVAKRAAFPPQSCYKPMELAIMGHHFRRVASNL